MKTRMAVGLVMLMLFVGISGYADADVLCANKKGSVFLRTMCKSKEVRLDPVALGLVGPQGPQGLPGIDAPRIEASVINIPTDTLSIGTGERVSCAVVRFAQPFAQPPSISLGVPVLSSSGSNIVHSLYYRDISRTGFDICLGTWADTHIYTAWMNWIAFGQ